MGTLSIQKANLSLLYHRLATSSPFKMRTLLTGARGKCGAWFSKYTSPWGLTLSTSFLKLHSLTNQWTQPLWELPCAWFSPEKVSWRIPLSSGQKSSASSNWDTTSGLESWCSAQGKREGLGQSLFGRKHCPAATNTVPASSPSSTWHDFGLRAMTTTSIPFVRFFLDSLDHRGGGGLRTALASKTKGAQSAGRPSGKAWTQIQTLGP